MLLVKVELYWIFFSTLTSFEREAQKLPGLRQRRVGSVNKCTRHLHCPGREKIQMKDRDGHCAFCSNFILTILLAKADILFGLVNCDIWTSEVVLQRTPGKFVIISLCDLKTSNDNNYKKRVKLDVSLSYKNDCK